MEKEYVLEWLKNVQSESDGGFVHPDKLSSNSSSYDLASISFIHSPKEKSLSNQSAGSSPAKFPPPAFQSPQSPSSPSAKLQLVKSNTISNEMTHLTSYMKAPSAPALGAGQLEHSKQEGHSNLRQSSLSPLPLHPANPELDLPTIALTQAPPRPRKPLVKQSSTSFLSELKSQVLPLTQPQPLLSSLVNSTLMPKSAPTSPNVKNTRKSGSWSHLSTLNSSSKCYSQSDVRQPLWTSDEQRTGRSSGDSDGGSSEGGSGSCVAEKGGLSDAASSGSANMPCGAWERASPSRELFSMPEVEGHEDSKMLMEEESSPTRRERAVVEDRLLPENSGHLELRESVSEEMFTPFEQPVFTKTSRRFPLSRQATVQDSSSPSPLAEVFPQTQFRETSELDSKPPPFSSKRKSLERSHSMSVQHYRSLSDNITGSRTQRSDHVLGVGSLAFHDHHLGRKGSNSRIVKSTTVEDHNPVSTGSVRPPQLSSLLDSQKGNTTVGKPSEGM